MTTKPNVLDSEIDAAAMARLAAFERELDQNATCETVGITSFPSAHEQHKMRERLKLLLLAHFKNQVISDRTAAAFEQHRASTKN